MEVLYTNTDFLFPNLRSGVNTCQVLVVVGTLDEVRRIQVFVNQANFENSRGTSVINAAESVVGLVVDFVLLGLLAERPDLRGLGVEWFFRVQTDDSRLNHVTRVVPALRLPSPGRWSRLSLALRGVPQCEVGTVSFKGWARLEELVFAQMPGVLLPSAPGGSGRALPG